jgi:two-component system CheB/CheR fusion protein
MCSLFTAFDGKQKLYQRKCNGCVARQSSSILSLPPNADPELSPPKVLPYIISLQELAEKALLQKVVQAGVLVNQKGDLLYLHRCTCMYFEPVTDGLDSYNILKMAREGLQHELIVALYKAASDNIVVHRSGLRVKTNGGFGTVNLSVSPLTINLTVGICKYYVYGCTGSCSDST